MNIQGKLFSCKMGDLRAYKVSYTKTHGEGQTICTILLSKEDVSMFESRVYRSMRNSKTAFFLSFLLIVTSLCIIDIIG